jgi:hypothetical protein
MIRLYILAFCSLLIVSCNAAPATHEGNSQPVSHQLWDQLLQKHVTDAGDVDYRGFIRDSLQLNQYLQLLSTNPPNEKNWSPDEQLAYWINAYNAYTIQLIIRHYPVVSIRDIGSKIQIPFVNSPWDIKFISIGNHVYDLNNIEHGIIRERFDEPRIHFALVCAARSCPRLLNRAYTASGLDEQLSAQGRNFLNDPAKNRIAADRVEISKLFDWYKGDFTKKGSLIDFLNRFSSEKINPKAQIKYLDYDWTLNSQDKGYSAR